MKMRSGNSINVGQQNASGDIFNIVVNQTGPPSSFQLPPGKIFTRKTDLRLAPYLVGREEQIRELYQDLEQPGATILLAGEQGVGKRELCKKIFDHYSHWPERAGDDPFEYIGYLEYSKTLDITLADGLEPSVFDGTSDRFEQAWDYLHYLSSQHRVLLIIAGMPAAIGGDPSLARHKSYMGALLCTCETDVAVLKAKPCHIGPLAEEDCRKLFEYYCGEIPEPEKPAWNSLVMLAGHNPGRIMAIIEARLQGRSISRIYEESHARQKGTRTPSGIPQAAMPGMLSARCLADTYEIREQIGDGGRGVVYLAWQKRLQKAVVLKADKGGAASGDEIQRREADTLKCLNHPYIPQVYDFFAEGGNVYTVLEYIQGESFDRILARGERFRQASVVKWMRQLLEAVVYLHSRKPCGILHGDIKPSNIMLTPSGDICLIDFNIALAAGEEGAKAIAVSSGYASPEQYGQAAAKPEMGGSGLWQGTVDVRSDIFMLGAAAYHILSGTKPPENAWEAVPLSKDKFSAGLVDIIAKAMDPRPEMRYQNAGRMLADVNRLHKSDARSRRYIRCRRFGCGILAALFLASGFCTVTGLKRMRLTEKSLVQAEYASNALERGDTGAALEHALAALPRGRGIFTPPPLAQAQSALTDALQVYDLADGYKPAGTLELPSPPIKIALSPDGRLAAAVYAYEAAVFRPEQASEAVRLKLVESALADAVFADERRLIYAGEQGICCYDAVSGKKLWSGAPALKIAVSADGKTIAAVGRGADEALLYAIDGQRIGTLSFQGKTLRFPADDSFGDPEDTLLCLNHDGSLLAASFADGSLDLFPVSGGEVLPVQPPSGGEHFEGGFYGGYFAFSAAGPDAKSVFAVIDTADMTQTGGFQADNPFGVLAGESGIYVSSENLVVKLDPRTGEQQEAAYTAADVTAYAGGEDVLIAATEDGRFELFDGAGNCTGNYGGTRPVSLVRAAGEFALAGTRDSSILRILQKKNFSENDYFKYDASYYHDEARVNEAQDRVMLFSYKGFRLYRKDGGLLCDTALPASERVTDQQYSHSSGNLAVLYKDALRIYSGSDGRPLFEKEGLRSVFYAPYGISILEADGTLSLIDIDTARPLTQTRAEGGFAALCGMLVDEAFLGRMELTGACRTADGYRFAVSDGVRGIVFNEKGKELLQYDVRGKSEAFFSGDTVFISPQQGPPAAYSLDSGREIRRLQSEAYLAYVSQAGGYILAEYVNEDGTRYGTLLNEDCEMTARLPGLTDTAGNVLFFDYKTGYIRKTRLYSLNELYDLVPDPLD